MSDLVTNKVVGVSYNPDDLRFGYSNPNDYYIEKKRMKALLAGKTRLFNLQVKYSQSYLAGNTFSVINYRDMLMSLAINVAMRCLQTSDVSYTSLTTHAQRYWKRYGKDFWLSVPTFEDTPEFKVEEGYYGLAGSLAFWLYKNQDTCDDLYPLQILERILEYFWDDLGITETLPKNKQEQLFNNLEIDDNYFELLTTALNKLYILNVSDQPSGAINPLKLLKQNFLSANDWANLKKRILLGEIDDALLLAIKSLQEMCNDNIESRTFYGLPVKSDVYVDELITNLLLIAKPAGLALVYQAFALEGLINAINKLNDLSESALTGTFAEFLSVDIYSAVRYEVAELLTTTYDAFGALGHFNSILEARGLAYRIFLSCLQLIKNNNNKYISEDGDYRLLRFVL
jgi:hypothetical protein